MIEFIKNVVLTTGVLALVGALAVWWEIVGAWFDEETVFRVVFVIALIMCIAALTTWGPLQLSWGIQ